MSAFGPPRVAPILLAALAVGACKDHETGASPAPTSTASAEAAAASLEPHPPTGLEDCDAYFEAARRCFSDADAELRAQLVESIARYDNQLEHATSEVAKQAVGVGCAAALDSLKEEPACK